jgi:transposase
MKPRRYEITDFEWSVIQPLLPNKPRGVARVDDRRVLNGIFWRLRTGSPWADRDGSGNSDSSISGFPA